MNILSQHKTQITGSASRSTGNHTHQFWQMDYYETSNKVTVELNGENFTFKGKQQPLIIIPPYVNHKIITQAPYVCYALKFEADFKPFSKLSYCIVPFDFEEALIKEILNGTEYKSEIETQVLGRQLDILMLKLLKSKGIPLGPQKADYDARIEKTIEYMNTNMLAMPSTEELAANVNMSVTHFCRVFKKETGVAPMEYHRGMIVQKAQKMLKYTDLNISQIAYAFKFPDIHTFSRTFKKMTGISPREYRNRENEQ